MDRKSKIRGALFIAAVIVNIAAFAPSVLATVGGGQGGGVTNDSPSGGSVPPSSTTMTISVKQASLDDQQNSCTSHGGTITGWHFIINGLNDQHFSSDIPAPASLDVTWTDGTHDAVSDLATVNAGAASYNTPDGDGPSPAAGSTISTATALISTDWSGQFVLSGVTCTDGPTPVIPESPMAILLPLSGLVVVGGVILATFRRRTAAGR